MLQQLKNLISDDDITLLEHQEELAFAANHTVPKADRRVLLRTLESIDVQACPGSGKTTIVAAKLMLLAQKWPFKHQGICVLSHTNVAKNEIISRLENSKIAAVQKLLSYPHFIGTIQEFTNKFLGIPLLRSCGIEISMIDTENCVEQIYKKLSHGTKSYIDNKSQHQNVLYDFALKVEADEIGMNVPTFPNGSTSASYKELKAVRETLIKDGYFFYHDFYIFAEMLLKQNSAIPSFLQKRFPVIFMDEMQDTQKFQDVLLQTVFPSNCADIAVQRFGDPDQAIFNGINNEEPNASYNGKTDMDFVINLSHRFDNSIARKVKNLSFNSVPLESELSAEQLAKRMSLKNDTTGFLHTIFLYNDTTIYEVIPRFADLIELQFNDAYRQSEKFIAKIVGGVGNEIDAEGQLKIGHYWNGFDKKKSKSSFKPASLIEAAYYCRRLPQNDLSGAYAMFNDCIVKLLRESGQKDESGKFFTAKTWKTHLKDNKTWQDYRQFLHWTLNPATLIMQQDWGNVSELFKSLLGLTNLPAALNAMVAFVEESTPQSEIGSEERKLKRLDNNALEHESGFKIQLSTIHGVKGETHDATLVLETKNRNPDIQAMMSYLTGILPDVRTPNSGLKPEPTNVRDVNKMANQKFMRQLYVATSRSKHLLCLAAHQDRVTTTNIANLEALGWKIETLNPIEAA